jgi:hypothetical protein
MSTAYTIQRIFTQLVDTSLRLGAAGYSRPMSVGGNWVRIRIGTLCSIDSGVTLGDTQAYLGLCSSWGSPVSGDNVGRFIGASLSGAPAGGGWTYAAGGGYPYLFGTANAHVFTKFQTTLLKSVAGSAVAYLAQTYTASKPRRTPIYVDITRPDGGCGLCTVTVYGCSSTTVVYDYRPDHFWAGLDAIGTPVVNGQTMAVLATSSDLPIGDELGAHDTFNVWYSRDTAGLLDIYALGASVIWTKPTAYQLEPASGAFESFEGLAQGTLTSADQIAAGTFSAGWSTAGTIVGVYAELGMIDGTISDFGYYGTKQPWPTESFESYGTGTIYQDFSLANTGQGWSGAGTVLGL